MRLALRIHLGALLLLFLVGAVGFFFDEKQLDAANAAFESFPLKQLMAALLIVFSGSWCWLLLQSWIMLVKSWHRRVGSENAKLFALLFFFSFFATYYFYWKRYEIDSDAA